MAGSNILVDLSGVDVVLNVKYQLFRSNGAAAYSGRTHTHTDSHLYFIDWGIWNLFYAPSSFVNRAVVMAFYRSMENLSSTRP